jgi:vanillate O-demethylase ferredoxin subunit
MLNVYVARRRAAADNVIALELRAPGGAALPPFTAGAHIDVTLTNGMIRQYSLLNDSAERHRYEIAILRDPKSRGGSVSAHEDIAEGMALTIGAPRNLFALAPTGTALLFAGGIGITPLLAMAHQLHREGRAFALHYCARTASAMAFRHELAASPFAVRFHTDDGDADQNLNAAAVLAAAAPDAQAYVCGPAGFIAHIQACAAAVGWAPGRVRFESFAASAPAPGAGFTLRLARRGIEIPVACEQTALDALQGAGVEIAVSCEQGICGTCRTLVLDGEPEHRDSFLTKTERARNTCFLPCVSRARTPVLVLDL